MARPKNGSTIKEKLRAAIKAAWIELGRTADKNVVIARVKHDSKNEFNPSWQQAVGVKSRIREHEWNQCRTKKTGTVVGDEVHTLYQPGDIHAEEAVKVHKAGTKPKHTTVIPAAGEPKPYIDEEKCHLLDREVVFLFNSCIDLPKMFRLIPHEARLQLGNICDKGRLVLGEQSHRFGLLDGTDGRIDPCDTL